MRQREIMNLFAPELGGSVDEWVQARHTSASDDPSLSGGYCCGASAAWLAMQRINLSLKSTMDISKEKAAVVGLMKTVQVISQSYDKTKLSSRNPTIPEGDDKALEHFGFKVVRIAQPPPQFPFDSAANFIYNGSFGGYFYIMVPTHAMAAHAAKGGRWSFFDPNAGIATFQDAGNFALFLCRYFCHRDTMKTYSLGLLDPLLLYQLQGPVPL
jgi:virulence surface antigen